MILGGGVAIEIAYETNAKSDVVQVIARNMTAIDLPGPAVTDFDLSIPRGISIADDEVVGEAILHFANASVVDIKNPRVSLAGATVMNDDVFPPSALHFGIIDGFAQGRRQVAPSFHEAAKKRFGWGFFVSNFLKAGFFD